MLYHIHKMTQTTMKLLLRNKGFLFFGFILPILATLIINVKNAGDSIVKDTGVIELANENAKVAYLNDYKMLPVKVLDSSDSEITMSFLNHLADEQLFQIYHVDVSDLSEEEILDSAKNTALKDKIGAIMIITKDFPAELMSGTVGDAVTLYETDEDERFDLLTSSAETILTQYIALADNASDVQELEQNVDSYEDERKQVSTKEYAIESDKQDSFMDVDYGHTEVLGYTLAILSLSFLFSGILILNTIMKEKENLVYTRIMLTKAGTASYLLSKFCVIILVTLIQTGIIGLAYMILVKNNVGFAIGQLLFLVFMMGLIFNSLSVCIGSCMGSVLSATYMSFFVWVITALLGGLYFDISGGSYLMRQFAMLMPQRWMLKGAQLFISGNSFAYSVILGVTAAYLIVILVIGMLGLKLNRKE